ncbi:hypothetical protein B9T07_26190 [Limnospira fusiformis CCALA 023]
MSDFSPVSRLIESLNKAQKFGNNKRTFEVWAEIFGYDSADPIEVYEGSVNYFKLVEHVEDLVVSLCGSEALEALYRKQYASIKNLALIFPNKGDWGAHRNKIDGAMLLNLEHSKVLFDQHVSSAETRVEDSYLENLLECIDDLFDKIFNSNLPREVRLKFLDDINLLKKSVRRYSFHGRDGVEQAMATMVGRVRMNGHELNKSGNEHVAASFMGLFTSFWGFMNASNVAASFIENARQAVKFINAG